MSNVLYDKNGRALVVGARVRKITASSSRDRIEEGTLGTIEPTYAGRAWDAAHPDCVSSWSTWPGRVWIIWDAQDDLGGDRRFGGDRCFVFPTDVEVIA